MSGSFILPSLSLRRRSVRHVLPVVLLLPSGVQDARDVLRARLPLWHRHHGHEDQDEDGLRHLGKITSILIVFKIIMLKYFTTFAMLIPRIFPSKSLETHY